MKQLKQLFLVFALMMMLVNVGWGQTNPAAFDLSTGNFSFTGFAAGTTTTYPTNMQGWKFATEPITATTSAPSADFALSVSTSGLTTGSIRNEVANGISILNSSSNNLGAVVVSINTTGRSNVLVTFTAQQLNDGTTRVNGLRLQYRIGTSGTFTDVSPTTEYLTALIGTNTAQTFTNVSLPSAVDNNPVVQVRWIYFAASGSGARDRIRLDDITISSSASGNTAPTLTTQAVNTIETTASTGNGNITNTGGVDPTVRGFCWDIFSNPDPDINDSKSVENGTFSTGAFTGSITSLTDETRYKVVSYATNSVGTGYGSAVNFWTLSIEPASYSSAFSSSPVSQTQIDLTFSAASTITNADGYIILQKTGSAPTGLPADANAYTVGNTIGDGTVAAIITSTSATTTNISGLTASTQYYFTILPYNYNGSNNETYNYKTDGVIPVVNATTSAPNDVDSYVSIPMVQANPLTISSLYDTDLEAIEVFKFNIIDVGTDGLETKVTQIKISAGAGNTTNWANTIQGVKLSLDGGSSFVTIGTSVITANSITIPITIGNLDLANGSSNEVSLFVYLKNSGLTDNQVIQFTIPKVSHEFMADATGSTFATEFPDVINSNQMTVDVVATKLKFVQQPSNTYINQVMAPAVTIEATDANNNRDLDKTGSVTLVSSGTMTGSVTATLSTGFGTFSDITHTAAGTGLTLTATLSPLTDGTSATFNISLIPGITTIHLPQYMQGVNGTNNNRLPFAFLAQLYNLKPSSTYRYYNLASLSTDNASACAGIVYIANTSGNFTTSSTGSLSTSGSYGEFTTDVNGSYTGWFMMLGSANARFTPGNYVFMRILLNDGAGGTSPLTYLTSSDSVKVINFGTNSSDGTGIRSTAFATAKNFILLYDNEEGTGRPISGTLVESDGVTPASMVSFYTTNVDGFSGAWGTIIPNNLATGVRRIEQRSLINSPSLNPGDLVNFSTSSDGVWGSTNTANPNLGTTALVINDAPLPVQLSTFLSSPIERTIKLKWTTASETNNSGFEVERVQSSELRVKSWEKIGYVQGHGTVNTPTNYSFEDKNLQTGKYKYRLKQIDHNGNYEYFELNGEVEIGVPKKYDLSQNYPNPFNPVTKINFDLPVDSKVTMLIYDITGREVAKLLNGEFKKAGYHTTDFNASSLSSGVYFYSLNTDAFRMTKKMVVVK